MFYIKGQYIQRSCITIACIDEMKTNEDFEGWIRLTELYTFNFMRDIRY